MSPLRGKRLLVILGSYRSKRHLYEHARALGVELVVVDGPGHWASECAGEGGLFERHIPVELLPFATFVDRAVAATDGCGLSYDGIGTIEEFAGGFAARIAARLGLAFHDVEAADRARDKHRAREACEHAGIIGPRFARIENAGDLDAAAARAGFPAVLKPVSGVGSVQAFRVTDSSELSRRFSEILTEVESTRAASTPGIGSDRGWFDLMWSAPPSLVLESFIDGPKYDVDLLLDGDRVAYGHATDDLEPCGLRDIRRVAPSGLDATAEAELVEHAAKCVRAIGFRRGAFNVEVKRTDQGPQTVEVNGRLGGYSTTDIHRDVWNVDLVEQWLRSCFGLPFEIHESAATHFVAESLLPSTQSGSVPRDGYLDHLAGEPAVVAARQWVFAGDRVAGVETGAPDWLGAVVTRGKSRADAIEELNRLASSIDAGVISDVQQRNMPNI